MHFCYAIPIDKTQKLQFKLLLKANMDILAHRGFWTKQEEHNTPFALSKAFDYGFGVETDLRDCDSKIVIAHDMPRGHEIAFENLLDLMAGRNLCLALNIKSDGLASEINNLLKKYSHTNYFTFDMSIPDMVQQHKLNLKVFTGISDIIPSPILFEQAAGIWLDCFNSDWFYAEDINKLLDAGKKVAIVSPELHKREYKNIWPRYKNINHKHLMICTDYPTEAESFFNEKN